MTAAWNTPDVSARDSRYWEAICHCLSNGGDTGHLVRSFLWDKVGRAARAAMNPLAGAAELAALGRAPRPAARRAAPAPEQSWKARLRGARIRLGARWRGRPLLFCPFPYSRHARILALLLDPGRDFAVGVAAGYAREWPGAVPLGVPATTAEAADEARAAELEHAIVDGLAAQGLVLADADGSALRCELRDQQLTLRESEAALDVVRPTAILLPADNHSPFIEYALAARRRGIPAIMLQHGLDCERHVLDEAYASHIATWGPERAARYRRDSQYQPEAMTPVGNPHYDAWPAAEGNADPNVWLWVTRPHRPEKCYLPSRAPGEGLAILDALLRALDAVPQARLLIKAHPFDYAVEYAARIQVRGADRARVVEDTVQNLLNRAGVVISEDSTAGMDAMLARRRLVHAHFAPSAPVMPFVAYGAATQAFNADELIAVLSDRGGTPPAQEAGQRRFLEDFAGPRDGCAGARFAQFVGRTLQHAGRAIAR